MHNRIASEKDAVLDELNARVEDALSELKRRTNRNGLPRFGPPLPPLQHDNDARPRDAHPHLAVEYRTLTGFISAALLPVGAGVIQGAEILLGR